MTKKTPLSTPPVVGAPSSHRAATEAALAELKKRRNAERSRGRPSRESRARTIVELFKEEGFEIALRVALIELQQGHARGARVTVAKQLEHRDPPVSRDDVDNACKRWGKGKVAGEVANVLHRHGLQLADARRLIGQTVIEKDE